eukprot:MONOS_9520.1-p1 / transcript=MONOS_9520.1 / gene=MONOS_9520 / organism=Monocercomonoides_exilis_PA203 / gene_product=unspecified product / transcript_product=unspecified product / location=Mono_scaffold00396:11596-16480(+) / protein_length=1454 / sequence_SO=supercontig / SO=protein_coding / is_pseudo=false
MCLATAKLLKKADIQCSVLSLAHNNSTESALSDDVLRNVNGYRFIEIYSSVPYPCGDPPFSICIVEDFLSTSFDVISNTFLALNPFSIILIDLSAAFPISLKDAGSLIPDEFLSPSRKRVLSILFSSPFSLCLSKREYLRQASSLCTQSFLLNSSQSEAETKKSSTLSLSFASSSLPNPSAASHAALTSISQLLSTVADIPIISPLFSDLCSHHIFSSTYSSGTSTDNSETTSDPIPYSTPESILEQANAFLVVANALSAHVSSFGSLTTSSSLINDLTQLNNLGSLSSLQLVGNSFVLAAPTTASLSSAAVCGYSIAVAVAVGLPSISLVAMEGATREEKEVVTAIKAGRSVKNIKKREKEGDEMSSQTKMTDSADSILESTSSLTETETIWMSCLRAFDLLGYKEGKDYTIVAHEDSSEAAKRKKKKVGSTQKEGQIENTRQSVSRPTIVRIDFYKTHKQTIQFLLPTELHLASLSDFTVCVSPHLFPFFLSSSPLSSVSATSSSSFSQQSSIIQKHLASLPFSLSTISVGGPDGLPDDEWINETFSGASTGTSSFASSVVPSERSRQSSSAKSLILQHPPRMPVSDPLLHLLERAFFFSYSPLASSPSEDNTSLARAPSTSLGVCSVCPPPALCVLHLVNASALLSLQNASPSAILKLFADKKKKAEEDGERSDDSEEEEEDGDEDSDSMNGDDEHNFEDMDVDYEGISQKNSKKFGALKSEKSNKAKGKRQSQANLQKSGEISREQEEEELLMKVLHLLRVSRLTPTSAEETRCIIDEGQQREENENGDAGKKNQEKKENAKEEKGKKKRKSKSGSISVQETEEKTTNKESGPSEHQLNLIFALVGEGKQKNTKPKEQKSNPLEVGLGEEDGEEVIKSEIMCVLRVVIEWPAKPSSTSQLSSFSSSLPTLSQELSVNLFEPSLSECVVAKIDSVATHPLVTGIGYGTEAVKQLKLWLQGKLWLSNPNPSSSPSSSTNSFEEGIPESFKLDNLPFLTPLQDVFPPSVDVLLAKLPFGNHVLAERVKRNSLPGESSHAESGLYVERYLSCGIDINRVVPFLQRCGMRAVLLTQSLPLNLQHSMNDKQQNSVDVDISPESLFFENDDEPKKSKKGKKRTGLKNETNEDKTKLSNQWELWMMCDVRVEKENKEEEEEEDGEEGDLHLNSTEELNEKDEADDEDDDELIIKPIGKQSAEFLSSTKISSTEAKSKANRKSEEMIPAKGWLRRSNDRFKYRLLSLLSFSRVPLSSTVALDLLDPTANRFRGLPFSASAPLVSPTSLSIGSNYSAFVKHLLHSQMKEYNKTESQKKDERAETDEWGEPEDEQSLKFDSIPEEKSINLSASSHFTPYDMQRLFRFSRGNLSISFVLDLLPAVGIQMVSGAARCPLTRTEAAVLVGVCLQRLSEEQISALTGLQISQITSKLKAAAGRVWECAEREKVEEEEKRLKSVTK